jgi:SPP1 family predicted phage head-tail adaptor
MRLTTSPSELNKRVTVQVATQTANGLGGFTTVWADGCKAYAAIWPVSASEMVKANTMTMVVTHRIRIRYCAGVVEPDNRIKFGTRYFSIVSIINPNEDNLWLDLLCKETVGT